jgi:hypothetical protein
LEPPVLEQCGYWGVAYAPPGTGRTTRTGIPLASASVRTGWQMLARR